MLYRCHNCDKGTTLSKVIQYINVDLYKEYVMERYVKDKLREPGEADHNKKEFKPKFDPPKFNKKDPKLRDLIPINKLTSDHPVINVIKRRRIPLEHYDKFFLANHFYKWANIESKNDHPRLVIPFFDENKNVFAAQGRAFGNEQPKYITIKFEDKPKIFGLDRINYDKEILVVEGPIDSLFLSNSLAVAGSDMIHSMNKIKRDNLIYVMDNEPRSREIIKKMYQLIDNNLKVCIWPNTLKEKDINDMVVGGYQNVEQIILDNSYSGLSAQVELNNWKQI